MTAEMLESAHTNDESLRNYEWFDRNTATEELAKQAIYDAFCAHHGEIRGGAEVIPATE